VKTSRCALGRTGVGVSIAHLEARAHSATAINASVPSARSHRVAAVRLAAESRPRSYGSVILAGPMASTDVPANKVVAGNSARLVKSWTEQGRFKRE
jgi:hypothetical protein